MNHHGNGGLVKKGTSVVAELNGWSFSSSVDKADDSTMGDTWKTHKTGLKEASGSVECWYDETDATGQEAMGVGDSVDLKLYIEPSAAGARYHGGTVTIDSVGASASKDGIITRTFNWTANGAFTAGTDA